MVRFVLLTALGIAAVIAWRRWRRDRLRAQIETATSQFARNIATLQEDFRAAANVSGKPRGLRWKACELQPSPLLARDRATSELLALVGVTISFEAVAGGGMEDVEAVGNLRAATAIFQWTGYDWTTTGKAVFNHEPREVLERYAGSLAPIT